MHEIQHMPEIQHTPGWHVLENDGRQANLIKDGLTHGLIRLTPGDLLVFFEHDQAQRLMLLIGSDPCRGCATLLNNGGRLTTVSHWTIRCWFNWGTMRRA